MKQFKIIKIVYANSLAQASKLEKEGEVVMIELNEDVTSPKDKIGFKK